MSAFDLDTIMNTQTSETLDTRSEPVPAGVYNAVIGDEWNEREITRQDGTSAVVVDIPLKIDAPGNDEADGRNVRYSWWVDFTPSGQMDFSKGKNLGLGRLRAAAKQNEPGKAWSPSNLKGAAIRVSVEHDVRGDVTYANVKMVAAID